MTALAFATLLVGSGCSGSAPPAQSGSGPAATSSTGPLGGGVSVAGGGFACLSGNWVSTAAGGTTFGLGSTLSGGSGITLKGTADGSLVEDFDGMTAVTEAGGPLDGLRFKIAGTATGTLAAVGNAYRVHVTSGPVVHALIQVPGASSFADMGPTQDGGTGDAGSITLGNLVGYACSGNTLTLTFGVPGGSTLAFARS
ncbi:MAG TPA: hypothetical protein VNG93_15335 [Candidatus Dormibacteraeota bacterium]|nr:hypothetical protein [Candidatus Dormibacteraeota bacterium]